LLKAKVKTQMRRFIITGAPGAGKTAVIRQLKLDGFSVVEEAATDVIAAAQAQGIVEPWMDASFVDAVARLQKDRQIRASSEPVDIQFHDRSVVCTAALAVYLGYPVSEFLAGELKRVKQEGIFQLRVFSFAISASSRPPTRDASALKKLCASRKSTKTVTGTSASNTFQLSRGVFWSVQE
jgi:predicted ATPase